MEAAVARVCREAGPRVVTNAFVRDLNLSAPSPGDGRRIEVVANNRFFNSGAQLAVDATLVSALRRNGTARPGAEHRAGTALRAARRRKERTYPELAGQSVRARLVVFGFEVGGRWSSEA